MKWVSPYKFKKCYTNTLAHLPVCPLARSLTRSLTRHTRFGAEREEKQQLDIVEM